MLGIMALGVLLRIVKYKNGGGEVECLSRGEEVEIWSAIFASVAVDPLEGQFRLGWLHILRRIQVVYPRWNVKVYRPSTDEYLQKVLIREKEWLFESAGGKAVRYGFD